MTENGVGLFLAGSSGRSSPGVLLKGSFRMLQQQLSLAVLASAFALFLGDADAEANQSRYQERRYTCRPSQPCHRVDVQRGCGIQGRGNYGVPNHSWNNSGQKHYGNGTHFNGGNRNGSYGCSW